MGSGVDERQSGDGFGRLTAGKSPHSMRGGRDTGVGRPASRDARATKERERGPYNVILPNEANFLEWVRLWIGLRDKLLRDQVGQIVTWLRFAGMGSFWGYWSIWIGPRWGENGFVWGSFGLVADGRGVTSGGRPVLRLTGVEGWLTISVALRAVAVPAFSWSFAP